MTYDLEGVGNDADSHELLSVVAAVHHEGVGQALDDGALSLAETLGGITASGVRKVDRGADLDVVAIEREAESAYLVSVPFRKKIFHRDSLRRYPELSCVFLPACRVHCLPTDNGVFSTGRHKPMLVEQSKSRWIGKHLRQGDVPDLNILVAPLVEQLHGSHLRDSLLGQDLEGRSGVFDLDFAVFRHFGRRMHLLPREGYV